MTAEWGAPGGGKRRQPSASTNASHLCRAEALASTLPPLLVAAERVAATVSQGVHGRRRVGDGESFWQFRRYHSGDAAHRIDWRQSAKSDRAFVRETEWEAAQSVWLWCDASDSMRWSSARALPSKRARAELLLLALAALLVRGGEHVALLGTGLPPSGGRAALQRLAVCLQRDTDARPADFPSADLLPRHGRVVLIGDFLAPIPALQEAVAGFAHRGLRGHLLHIVDPAEETLPFAGRVLFSGSEREGERLFGRVESVRPSYRDAFARHRDAIRETARRAGWSALTHRTDHAPEIALLSLYLALSGPDRR
ncbi:MAG: DUF58 domain-containing protein [Rhodospirillales bacterium]|nr:DUF58 domain-containing protein [Rhodospirillales bacterium]